MYVLAASYYARLTS